MIQDKKTKNTENSKDTPLIPTNSDIQKKVQAGRAYNEAEKDMEKDDDLSSQNTNSDLDEGELARREGNNDSLI